MRTVGRLPDARMQITVFENDGRFPVQFELGGLTQIYRFRKGPRISNFGHLREYIDEAFRTSVFAEFQRMRELHNEVLVRISPPEDELDQLPSII